MRCFAFTMLLVACGPGEAVVQATSPSDPSAANRPDAGADDSADRDRNTRDAEALAKLKADVLARAKPMTGECSDDALFQENLKLIPSDAPPGAQSISAELTDRKTKARDARWKAIAASVEDDLEKARVAASRRWPEAKPTELSKTTKEIADLRSKLDTLKCSDRDAYADLPKLKAKVEEWAAATERKIAELEKARKK